MPERAAAGAVGAGERGRHELDVPAVLAVGLAGTMVLLATVLFLQGLYNRAETAVVERMVVREAPEELQRLRAEQLAVLNGFRWVDEKAGVVAVPIDLAMELVVRDYRARAAGGAAAGRTP